MKRRIAVLIAAMMVLSVMAGPAMAKPQMFDESHGHMLVLGVQAEFLTVEGDSVPWDGLYAVGFRKCIDMPITPLRGHHANVHMGQAGMALEGAGNAFVPSYNFPHTEWDNCADLADDLPVPLGPPPPPPPS